MHLISNYARHGYEDSLGQKSLFENLHSHKMHQKIGHPPVKRKTEYISLQHQYQSYST